MNRVLIIGNLTRDPEMRTTAGGVSVCNFTVAVNRRYKNASGETEADYLNVVAWRQLGELCGRYLSKGRKAAVTGSIQVHSYTDRDGTKRTAFDIVAEEVEFLSPQKAGTGGFGAPPEAGGGYTVAASKGGAESAPQTSSYGGYTEADDDELPF